MKLNLSSSLSAATLVAIWLSFLALLAPVAGCSLPAAEVTPPAVEVPPPAIEIAPDVTGLWGGQVLYAPAMVEIDFMVEIATTAEGELVGTIDIPSQRMKLHLLEAVRQDGESLHFEFDRFPERDDVEAVFTFDGAVEEDGQVAGRFQGVTDQGPVEAGFTMARIGDVGSERPEPVYSELVDLSADLGNLRQSFNDNESKVRIVNLISPTCGVCRITATIMQRYLLDEVDSNELEVFTVWGPMLGDETREAAVDATSTMPDSRVVHYWTTEPLVAESFQPVTGLEEGELAWDTFLIYEPGIRWEETPPTPTQVLHVNKPLPEETRLHGDRLREQIQDLLGAS